MSDNKQPEQNQDLSGAPSPEELEAAQAANEADALSAAQAEPVSYTHLTLPTNREV